jgi:hypothetical protein
VSYNEKSPVKTAPKSNDFMGWLNDVRMFRALHITPKKQPVSPLKTKAE